MAAGRFGERVAELLHDAARAAERGDWATARALAEAVLALEPHSRAAQELVGRAAAAQLRSGERRQLTVLFADVVGSTALSQTHDPEVLSDVLRRYQAICDDVVRRYEGRVARFLGDGVLAYFGHPVAHEDDARRAVQAGLELVRGVHELAEEVQRRHDLGLRVRVAVHTGLVVLADMGTAATPDPSAVVGEAPNLAARLQDRAEPGSLLISEATYDLVRPWFSVAPVGELELRGIAHPVAAFEVLDEVVVAPVRTGAAPLVGRDRELDELVAAWAEAREGSWAQRALVGPPGIGKSRLVAALRDHVEADGGTVLVTGCSSLHRSSALFPARLLVERTAEIEPRAAPDVARERLRDLCEGVGRGAALPLIADLLGLPPTDWCPAPELDGAERRERLLGALVDLVGAVAAGGPTLLAVEDLHWVDATTTELLHRIARARAAGLLLVVTAREEAKVPWSDGVVELAPLPAAELRALAAALPEADAMAPGDLDRAIDRSDGVPLFFEELVRAGATTAPGPGRSRIPSTLHDLLLARYAAPGVDREVARLLATIGAEAPLPLLAAAAPLPAEELDRALAAMVDAAIVELAPGDPPVYRFRHHLLAELAYDTQLSDVREANHLAVATALLEGLGGAATVGPEVLAHHLDRGGRPDEAVEALVAAAGAAHRLGANAEVSALLGEALTLLERVDPSRRPPLEFEVRLLRATNTTSQLGYAAPQVIEDLERCREIADTLPQDAYLDGPDVDPDAGFRLIWAGVALWAAFFLQGDLDRAEEVNRTFTERLHPDGELRSYYAAARGFVELFRGEITAAVANLAAVVEAVTPSASAALAPSVPNDPRVAAMAHHAFALCLAGDVAAARATATAAVARAEAVPFPEGPFSSCMAFGILAGVEAMTGDWSAAAKAADRLAAVAERHGFTFWGIFAGYYAAVVALRAGEEGAVDRCRGALLLFRASGVQGWLPVYYASLADLSLSAGHLDEADDFVSEALGLVEATGVRFCDAELARIRGCAALARGDERGVEHLRTAVDVAEAQGARLYELRARLALAEASGAAEDVAGLAGLVAAMGPLLDELPAEAAAARALLGTAS